MDPQTMRMKLGLTSAMSATPAASALLNYLAKTADPKATRQAVSGFDADPKPQTDTLSNYQSKFSCTGAAPRPAAWSMSGATPARCAALSALASKIARDKGITYDRALVEAQRQNPGLY